ELFEEALVGLLLRLVVDLLHQRTKRVEFLLYLPTDLGSDRPEGTGGHRRTRATQEDRHLDPVVPVVLHRVDLRTNEQTRAEEGQRHRHGDDDGERHREVAPQTLEGLAEDESEFHGWWSCP